mgnify:CR=1 FL=1
MERHWHLILRGDKKRFTLLRTERYASAEDAHVARNRAQVESNLKGDRRRWAIVECNPHNEPIACAARRLTENL